jgi:hypothetical protein
MRIEKPWYILKKATRCTCTPIWSNIKWKYVSEDAFQVLKVHLSPDSPVNPTQSSRIVYQQDETHTFLGVGTRHRHGFSFTIFILWRTRPIIQGIMCKTCATKKLCNVLYDPFWKLLVPRMLQFFVNNTRHVWDSCVVTMCHTYQGLPRSQ